MKNHPIPLFILYPAPSPFLILHLHADSSALSNGAIVVSEDGIPERRGRYDVLVSAMSTENG